MGSNRAQRTSLCELTALYACVCVCVLCDRDLMCFRRKVWTETEAEGEKGSAWFVYLDSIV